MGALTSKPYAFVSRPWELKSIESVDFFDSLLSSIRYDCRTDKILRILPVVNFNLNEEWISDRIRFYYDSVLIQRLNSPWIKVSVLSFFFEDIYSNIYIRNVKEKLACGWRLAIEVTSHVFNFYKLNNEQLNFGILNSNNSSLVETKSLLSLTVVSGGYNKLKTSFFNFRCNYLINLNNLFTGNSITFVGINLRLQLPILNLKIKELISSRKLDVYSYGFYNFNYFVTYIGSEINSLYDLIFARSSLTVLLLKCGLSTVVIESKYYDMLLHLSARLARLTKINFTWLNAGNSGISFAELGHKLSTKKILNAELYYLVNSDNVIKNCIVQENVVNMFNDLNKMFIYAGSHGDVGAENSDLVYPIQMNVESGDEYYLDLNGNIRFSRKIISSLDINVKKLLFLNKILNFEISNFLIDRILEEIKEEDSRYCVNNDEMILKDIDDYSELSNVNNDISYDSILNKTSRNLVLFKNRKIKDYVNFLY